MEIDMAILATTLFAELVLYAVYESWDYGVYYPDTPCLAHRTLPERIREEGFGLGV